MSSHQLHLQIVSQEEKLVDTEVDSITAPASEGEVTVLPKHISLFTKLEPGELIYRDQDGEESLVVSTGFMDVNVNNSVTVMVDSAVAARNISLEKAQQAIRDAEKSMEQAQDSHELMMAEASLKRALLEVKVAQKTKKSNI